jgi:predicted DsbA family dithiol-disulfide isomerase
MAELRVDVWSDIACPWCAVGKRRLERALKEFPHASDVKVVWRAFELDPTAPKERDPTVSHDERIARKYGMTLEQARRSADRLREIARAEGLAFDFEHIRSGNTFDAHRLIHLGRERGFQGVVKERFMRAYLEEGALMSEHQTLVRLAGEAGLDESEASAVLSSDLYAREVRADEAQAHELGINGVPCFVLEERFAVSGAQPLQVMLSALHHAWSERERLSVEIPESA